MAPTTPNTSATAATQRNAFGIETPSKANSAIRTEAAIVRNAAIPIGMAARLAASFSFGNVGSDVVMSGCAVVSPAVVASGAERSSTVELVVISAVLVGAFRARALLDI